MNDKIMIDVNNVTIRFNLANQKVDNLKEYFIKLVKKELMFQEFLALKTKKVYLLHQHFLNFYMFLKKIIYMKIVSIGI